MGIFRRNRGHSPTGNALDDELLTRIAERSDLGAGRHWVHYLYFPGEHPARAAADQIKAAGWGLQTVDVSAAGGPEWIVIAEKHDAVTGPQEIREARDFFESIGATYAGDYDGWEASL